MSAVWRAESSPEAEGRVLDLVLRDGHPLVVVVSPPGAGKTRLIESLVATAVHGVSLRVAVATPRTEQMYDVLRRLLGNFDPMEVIALYSKRRPLPDDLEAHLRLRRFTDAALLPAGPGVTVGTVDKFAIRAQLLQGRFDVLICDEAYQVPFVRFFPLTFVARQVVLVGDPGQLPPLVRADTTRFEATPVKVHWPAPKEFLARFPAAPTVQLPVTWRLPQDTVDLIQPAFYPDLAFDSAVRSGERRLVFGAAGLRDGIDRVLDQLASGSSVGALVLPERRFGPDEVDDQLSEVMALVARRTLDRGGRWVGRRVLERADIGVADPHVASGAVVRRYLRRAGIPTTIEGVVVETPEIWQGLQRPIMVVKHPLSGATRLTGFPLEPGRWCVSLSRHQIGCVIVTRDGISDTLDRHQHDSASRPTGADDPQWAGWLAHRELWTALERTGRLVRL
jgi:AAA domain-containing protein